MIKKLKVHGVFSKAAQEGKGRTWLLCLPCPSWAALKKHHAFYSSQYTRKMQEYTEFYFCSFNLLMAIWCILWSCYFFRSCHFLQIWLFCCVLAWLCCCIRSCFISSRSLASSCTSFILYVGIGYFGDHSLEIVGMRIQPDIGSFMCFDKNLF